MVSIFRFLGIVVYIAYLVNVGLLFIVLPWSQVWGVLLTRCPMQLAEVLGLPSVRGALSAFGVLHLTLVLWELMHPTLLTSIQPPERESQNQTGS